MPQTQTQGTGRVQMALKGDNMAKIKISNRRFILRLLQEQGPLSRKMIASSLGLTPSAITLIVGDMIKEGIIREGVTISKNGNVGRKEVLVEINSGAFCALGIAINLDNVIISATDLDGNIIFEEKISIQETVPVYEIVRKTTDILKQKIKEYHLSRLKIVGLGIIVRGIIDKDKKESLYSFGGLQEKNVPLREMFEKATGFPTFLENNVRGLMQAEMFLSHARGLSSQLFIRCEYGIGAALSIDHKMWNGSHGRCAELGHTQVVTQKGKLCRCGKTGCLETVASPTAIKEDVLEIYGPEETPILFEISDGNKNAVTVDDILEAARQGDYKVAEIVDRAVDYLSIAIKTVLCTVDPDKVIFYGKMFENDYYLNKMKRGLDDWLLGSEGVIVEKSRYNLELESKEAAIVAIDQFYDGGGIMKE